MNNIKSRELPSLRSIRSVIPPELDTITRKCLEKLPSKRFATVEKFEEDLNRWLSNRPIEARPPSLGERLQKMRQRHPKTFKWVSLACVLFLGLNVAYSLVLQAEIRRTEEQKSRAEEQEVRAEEQKVRAEEQKVRAEQSEILATQHRDALLVDLATTLRRLRIMKRYPGLARIRQDILADVRNRLDQLTLFGEANQPVTLLRVNTLIEVGSIEYEADRPERAHAYWDEAEKGLNSLEPTDEARRTRTVIQCHRGDVYLSGEDWAQAEKAFTTAAAERDSLWNQTRLESDLKLLARALRGLGESRARSGNAKGAEEPFEKALTICRQLRAANADDASLRDLSVALTGRADVAKAMQDPAVAKNLSLEARQVDRQRIERDAHDVDAVVALSVDCNRLGDLAEDELDLGTAVAWHAQSLEADLTVRQMEPSVPGRYRHLLISRQRMLKLSLNRGDWIEAEQHAAQGARTANDLLRLPAPSDLSRQAAGFSHYWLGLSQAMHGDLDMSRKTLTESDRVFQDLLKRQIAAEIRRDVTRTNLLNSLQLVGVELESNNFAAASQWTIKFDAQFAGTSPDEKKEWNGLSERAARLKAIIAAATKGLTREAIRLLPVEQAVPLHCLRWNELSRTGDVAGMRQVLNDLRTLTVKVPEELDLVARVHARAARFLRGGRKMTELSMEERREYQQLVENVLDSFRAAVLARPKSQGAIVLHSDFDDIRTTPEFMQWWEQHRQRFKLPLTKIDP